MVILEFICIIIFVFCALLYINNIIVDIGSAIASTRSFNNDGSDIENAKLFARYRMVLSLIMGITLAIIICF